MITIENRPAVIGKLTGHAYPISSTEDHLFKGLETRDCNYSYVIDGPKNSEMQKCISVGHGTKDYGAVVKLVTGDLKVRGCKFDMDMAPLKSYRTDQNHDIFDVKTTAGRVWSKGNDYADGSDGLGDIKSKHDHYFVDDRGEGFYRMFRPTAGVTFHLIRCRLKTLKYLFWLKKEYDNKTRS
jgi:hypothetical protein